MKHSEVVRLGGLSCRLWQSPGDGRWRWHSRRGGKRVLNAAKELGDAKAKAKEQLALLRDGRSQLGNLDPALLSEFLAWKGQRADSPATAEAARQYVAHLTERKVQTRTIEADIKHFTAKHPGPIADVAAESVKSHLDSLGVGPRRYNNVRASLVSFFGWARKQGFLPDTMTAPQRTHALPVPKKRPPIYTPPEFRALLAAVAPEWRLPLAICGLAGLRTCEAEKLLWREVKLGKKLIEVLPENAKNTGRRRLVPIHPALMTWFRKAGEHRDEDHVCPQGVRIDNLAKRVRRKKVTWVKNGLRHSYGSYRCAVVKSAAQVALEMGNSEGIVRSNYLEYVERGTAAVWFKCGYFDPS
jgi:integrase